MPSLDDILKKNATKAKLVPSRVSIATEDRPYSITDNGLGNHGIITQDFTEKESTKNREQSGNTTGNKVATNREQSNNKPRTKWQQTNNKAETKLQKPVDKIGFCRKKTMNRLD